MNIQYYYCFNLNVAQNEKENEIKRNFVILWLSFFVVVVVGDIRYFKIKVNKQNLK